MNKTLLLVALMPMFAMAELRGPALYQMTESQLLAKVKSGALDDRVTACQELCHRGGPASVKALGGMLSDATEPALFHAALYGLQNIPGPESDAALAGGEPKVTGDRLAAVRQVRAMRARPELDGYAGATAKLTAFPPKTAAQRGDLAAFPGLVKCALGTGREAAQARWQLIGFPNEAVVAKLFGLVRGGDKAQARLALNVLAERRARSVLPQLFALARSTGHDWLRTEIFRTLGNLCDARQDLPAVLALLAEMPTEERLAGAVVRMSAKAFDYEMKPVTVLEAKFGNFEAKQVADVKLMVDALVAAGSREIMSGCRLVGRGGFPSDPARGLSKELRITYRFQDGETRRAVVPENEILAFGDNLLPAAVAKPLIDAWRGAKGPAREAFRGIVAALERRGRVPGSDEVLFRPIFNGKDLTGWKQDGDFLAVRDGVLVAESTPAKPCTKSRYFIYTAEQFGDFELRGSFRLSKDANSGIQLRAGDDLVLDTGYQADMDGAGAIVGYLFCTGQHLVGQRGADVLLAGNGRKQVERFASDAEMRKLYRAGDWNDIRIVAKGRIVAVWINGVRTVAVADARTRFLPEKGYLGLQLHQGKPMKIEFRGLRVRTDEVMLDPNLEKSLTRGLEALDQVDAPSFKGATWIWHEKGQKDGAKVTFRAELELPAGEIEQSAFVFSCDDSAVFNVNGKSVASQVGNQLWYTPTVRVGQELTNLRPGRNLIEVAAANNLGRAAFLAVVEVAYADGRVVRFPTGKRGWKASIDGGKTFVEPTEICPYGEGIYGTFEQFRGNRNSR